MKTDLQTAELPGLPKATKRGRPTTGKAKSAAERQREYRERLAEKTWNYAEITATTETRIERLMEMARSTGRPESDKRRYAAWAYGAWLMWNELTTGRQAEGDSERLEALTEI